MGESLEDDRRAHGWGGDPALGQGRLVLRQRRRSLLPHRRRRRRRSSREHGSGFHGVAAAVAYERGDISWNEGEDLLWDAGKQALIMAAITRGLGAATSRLGFAGARGLRDGRSAPGRRIAYGATAAGAWRVRRTWDFSTA